MAFSARVSQAVMAQINVTPLVDVLLVLLIIFMITSPIATHKATMDLPQASSQSPPESVPPIHLAIHADGEMDWNEVPVRLDQLAAQLRIAAGSARQPALQIAAADGVAYDSVARVLAMAKAQGMVRIDMLGER